MLAAKRRTGWGASPRSSIESSVSCWSDMQPAKWAPWICRLAWSSAARPARYLPVIPICAGKCTVQVLGGAYCDRSGFTFCAREQTSKTASTVERSCRLSAKATLMVHMPGWTGARSHRCSVGGVTPSMARLRDYVVSPLMAFFKRASSCTLVVTMPPFMRWLQAPVPSARAGTIAGPLV